MIMVPIPIPVSAHNFTLWLKTAPVLRNLAKRIGEREGWGADPWQWTGEQRGRCREEIRARLNVDVLTNPRPAETAKANTDKDTIHAESQ